MELRRILIVMNSSHVYEIDLDY